MLSANEWDTLKEVIVGRADHARIPEIDVSVRTINYAHRKDVTDIPVGPYPQQVIEEANQDLDQLANFLQVQGVKVHRPEFIVQPEYYNYCPRDTALVLRDQIIETPNPVRARANENINLRSIFHSMGPTVVRLLASRNDSAYNLNCIDDADTLALNETEPLFDAANILRANDELYYLVSNTGNLKGFQRLQEMLGQRYKVYPLQGIYSYIHIDSTIAFLQEGLMLLNPSRVKSLDQLPKPLQSWDVIWAPDPVDIGFYNNDPRYNNASVWVSVNLFMVNPTLAIVEEHQINLARMLEAKGIDVALLPMRHARTLSGCFHCVTLDLVRR